MIRKAESIDTGGWEIGTSIHKLSIDISLVFFIAQF